MCCVLCLHTGHLEFLIVITVNVEIFAQYIFSRISRRALDVRKLDVSENDDHIRTNRIKWYVCGKLKPIFHKKTG